jgi:hypothetical protein
MKIESRTGTISIADLSALLLYRRFHWLLPQRLQVALRNLNSWPPLMLLASLRLCKIITNHSPFGLHLCCVVSDLLPCGDSGSSCYATRTALLLNTLLPGVVGVRVVGLRRFQRDFDRILDGLVGLLWCGHWFRKVQSHSMPRQLGAITVADSAQQIEAKRVQLVHVHAVALLLGVLQKQNTQR